jgi:hypothetical protein
VQVGQLHGARVPFSIALKSLLFGVGGFLGCQGSQNSSRGIHFMLTA